MLLNVLPMVLLAQDGWLFSASPPIVVRYDSNEGAVHFTNTSDVTIHGVTLHNGEKHRVIIDTIEPHKTVAVDLASVSGLMIYGEMTITCTNYSKPLKVKIGSY